MFLPKIYVRTVFILGRFDLVAGRPNDGSEHAQIKLEIIYIIFFLITFMMRFGNADFVIFPMVSNFVIRK